MNDAFSSTTDDRWSHLWDLLDQEIPHARDLRRRLHQDPETSGEESGTRRTVLDAMPSGVSVTDAAGTGAVVRIGGDGPAIGVRGEMDALPITEATGAEFASRRGGVMHACGHDVHMAATVALARALAHPEANPPAALLVVLQPREETYPSGAQDVVGAGLLETQECRAMLGAHVHPGLPQGTVACVPGGVNASSDEFTVTIEGRGGHAAYPHLTQDPVLAAASFVVAVQGIVARGVDPMEPVVLGVSSLAAGEPANVVPDTAVARGTIRAMSEAVRELLHDRLRRTADHVAQAHGCTATLEITLGEPVLVNDPTLVAHTTDRLHHAGYEVDATLRSAGADDFAFYGEHVPTLMMFVGVDTDDALHTPTFLPDDQAVADAARALLAGYLAAVDGMTTTG